MINIEEPVAVELQVEEPITQEKPEVQEIDEETIIQEELTVVEEQPQSLEEELVLEVVSATEVNELISNEKALSFVKYLYKKSTTGKKTILNIAVLSRNFEAYDEVTLETLKEKKLIDKSVVSVKLLAGGILDKPLNVKLQSYSIEAIKMILLTGGTVEKIN